MTQSTRRSFFAMLAVAASLILAPVQSFAQQSVNALPPALRAALLSGNAAQIQAAMQTLSGGNPAQLARRQSGHTRNSGQVGFRSAH